MAEPPEDGERDELDLGPLSPREREILEAALDGLSAHQIASRFFVSEATVRSHLSSIYRKTGVHGRVELLVQQSHTREPQDAPALTQPPRPDVHHPAAIRRRAILLVSAAAIVAASALLALLRPDLPPRADLATASRLLAARHVAQLDLSGVNLTVTTADGQRWLVEGVDMADFERLRAAADPAADPAVALVVRSPDPVLTLAVAYVASVCLPAALLALVLLLVLRTVSRRGPPLRLAG